MTVEKKYCHPRKKNAVTEATVLAQLQNVIFQNFCLLLRCYH